jgi:hypothetical protein
MCLRYIDALSLVIGWAGGFYRIAKTPWDEPFLARLHGHISTWVIGIFVYDGLSVRSFWIFDDE